MSKSSIEWTDKTWNPTKGCSKVSPGCSNCYAIRMAARLQAMGHPSYRGITRKSGGKQQWTGKVVFDERALLQPLRWRKPRRIFVNSMSDLFHEEINKSVLIRIWEVMAEAHWHQFQILTKRPERMRHYMQQTEIFTPLENVWLGVSVESEPHMERLEILRDIPARVRFTSLEPLLGPLPNLDLSQIDWAIVGGESGPGARPIKIEWVEEIQAACRRSKTAFFFKQWGGVNKKKTGRMFRNKVWDEYPNVAVG